MFYNGSEEEGRKNFRKFYDLGECANENSDVQVNAAVNSRDQNPFPIALAKSLSNP